MDYTEAEWNAKGKKLFGDNHTQWWFKCPSCNRVQCVEEFRQFKPKGANPNTAYQECMGRYTGGRKGPHKCDWAAFGLFQGPDMVTREDGTKIPVFEFAEGQSGHKKSE